MYLDPMGIILIHRHETERALVKAELRRTITERIAEGRSTDERARAASSSAEGEERMPKFRLFHLAS